MEVDSDVQPLLDNLKTTIDAIRDRVLPPFSILDEDLVTANYTPDEQARLSLAAAFALIMSYYSCKKLRNEPITEQLKLKVERVSDYVKKLREIVEREKIKRDLAAAAASKDDKSAIDAAPAGASSRAQKRPLDEAAGESLPASLPAFKRPRVDKELVASLTSHVTGASSVKGRVPDSPSGGAQK